MKRKEFYVVLSAIILIMAVAAYGMVGMSERITDLQYDNEVLWQRVESLEQDKDLHDQSITILEEDVDEISQLWQEADTFKVYDDEGECDRTGFRIEDKVYIPEPCKKSGAQGFFTPRNDEEFYKLADALLAAYGGETDE